MYFQQFSGLLTWVLMLSTHIVLFAAVSDALQVGDKAPSFVANDQDGNLWKFEDHLGKGYLVVYFYPAAMTGGCTKQACSYRDQKSGFDDMHVEIVGISGDPVRNLKYFQEAQQLNFTLLSDVSGEIATKFGVPIGNGGVITRSINGQDKNLERMVTASRWTFVIDPQGKVVYKDAEVNAAEDSQKVSDFVRKHSQAKK
ncbi:MAG: peroxiredoxin [bacterium]